jgi:hypothetical protein
MDNAAVTAIVLRLLVGCYGYLIVMSGASVAVCEARRSSCGAEWTQAFTVTGGATSTLWAYITDSPNNPRTRSRAKSTEERAGSNRH